MITINLLPREYQSDPPTSMTRVLIIASSATIGLLSFAVYLFVHFSTLHHAQMELEQVRQERKDLEKMGIEKEHAKIGKLVKVASEREESVVKIRYMRSDLSRKLYEFSGICQQFPVWFDGLNIERLEEKGNKKKRSNKKSKKELDLPVPKYDWSAPGTCVANDLKTPVQFYQSIENSDFFNDFLSVEVPNYSKIEFGEEFQERIGYTFNLGMQMQIQPPPVEEEEEGKEKKEKS